MCGRVGNIGINTFCYDCNLNKNKCIACDAILREGVYKFFQYDTKEYHRDIDIEFKVSKRQVIEFETEELYDKLIQSDTCNECLGWENKIKNTCFLCGCSFENTITNYKLNGNLCEGCSEIFNKDGK